MSKAIRDLIEAETLTFQDEEKLLTELDQLEADAELGRAVKEWFKQCHVMEYTGVEVWNEQDLLEWYRAQKEVE